MRYGGVYVAADARNLPPGAYTGTVTITAPPGSPNSVAVPVTLNVTAAVPRSLPDAPPLGVTITNGASQTAGAVAPGEVVSIYGLNIGPATPAGFSLDVNGNVATNLNGARVLFEDTPAPVLYASQTQVNVVVPYEVAGTPSVNIAVEFNGARTVAAGVPVVPSAPGIFTSDGSGQGQSERRESGWLRKQRCASGRSRLDDHNTCHGTGPDHPRRCDRRHHADWRKEAGSAGLGGNWRHGCNSSRCGLSPRSGGRRFSTARACATTCHAGAVHSHRPSDRLDTKSRRGDNRGEVGASPLWPDSGVGAGFCGMVAHISGGGGRQLGLHPRDLPGIMRILITNISMASRTGTEIVTRDLAMGLASLGHRPVVFSPVLGGLADELREAGIPVVSRLEDITDPPDIIHGHHRVETGLALRRFPRVPAIFVCHDRLHGHDDPPISSQIRRYVAVDRNCLERLTVDAGIPEEQTRLIFNAVDTRRFPARPPLPAAPRRALIFSNYAAPGTHVDAVRQACSLVSLPLEVIGAGMGAGVDRPECVLGGYDLVFAKARCALEAMAAGVAVILCDTRGLGPFVTPACVADLREWNFGMRCLRQPLNAGTVLKEILAYDARHAAEVTAYIRRDAALDAALEQYQALYAEVQAEDRTASGLMRIRSRRQASGHKPCMSSLSPRLSRELFLRLTAAPAAMFSGARQQFGVELENRSGQNARQRFSAPRSRSLSLARRGDERTDRARGGENRAQRSGRRGLMPPPERGRDGARPRGQVRLARDAGSGGGALVR